MKKLLTVILLVLLTPIIPANTGLADTNTPDTAILTVDEVLKNYQNACGMPSDDIKNEVGRGTLVRGGSGKVPFETFSQSPDKWRYSQTFAWGDRITFAYDGTTAWVQDADSIYSMEPERQLDLSLLFDFHSSAKLQTIFPKMKIINSHGTDDTVTTTILATTPNGLNRELAFDKKTGLLVRVGDIRLDDYREVGSTRRPFKITLGINQKDTLHHMVFEFSDVQHNQDIESALYDQPGCVLTKTDSPIYRPRVRAELSIEALDACVGEYIYPRDTSLIVEVVRQDNHLMMGIKGFGGKMEIVPESDVDYYINFLNREYHFVKDESGKVVAMEFGADRVRGKRINHSASEQGD